MHIYKGVHTLIQKEHMHLHKEVHAFGQEVVMLTLRNTRTRQGNRHPWIWKYMHIHKGTHALIQRSTCVWARRGNACFEKHANTPREQMPLNMEVHAHTPRSTRTFVRLWKWFSAPFDAMRITVQVRYDARATREAVPPRAFERYLFWWLWTTEVTPKEKPPTRKTNEGMLTS